MSYILDALRRAEAERERGAVPSLASQQHSIEVEEEAPQRPRALVWAVIGLAFALIATLAWTLLGSHGAPPRQIAEAPPATTPMPIAPAAVPQSLAEIAATPSAAAVPAAPVQQQPQAVIASPSMSPSTSPPNAMSPSPSRSPSQVPMPAPVPRAVAAPIARTPAPLAMATPTAEPKRAAATTVPSPAPATASNEPRIYAQAELPEDVRRDLPRIAINGSSYSGDAASRMVMINGQVFHEGDQLSAGLVLDKIRRRSAVLIFKGYRYELMF